MDGNEEKHNACYEEEGTETQMQALLQCLALVARLATMDTDDYQRSLREGQAYNEPNSSCQLQKNLDGIQRHWKLEETPILQLASAVHRLHSTVHNLQQDAGEHVTLYSELARRVKKCQKRNAKLENALKKVCAKNEKLRAKIDTRDREKHSMMTQIRSYMQKVKDAQKEQSELEEKNVVYQLQAHQNVLRGPLRKRSVSAELPARSISPQRSNVPPSARKRVMSQDSNFSQVDPFDFDRGTDPLHDYIEGDLANGDDDGQYYDKQEGPSSGGDDSSVFSATSSASSLITDEGIATVRLKMCASPDRSMRSGANNKDEVGDDRSSCGDRWPSLQMKAPSTLTLSFPGASAVGLQFEKIAWNDPSRPRTAESLRRPLIRKGIISDALLRAEDDENDLARPEKADYTLQNQNDGIPSSGFQLTWNSVFGKSESNAERAKTSAPIQGTTQSDHAFVVCGFYGFCDELNERPKSGARLVALNGEPIDSSWSLKELQDHIQNAFSDETSACTTPFGVQESPKGRTCGTKALTLTFSHDSIALGKGKVQPVEKTGNSLVEDSNLSFSGGGPTEDEFIAQGFSVSAGSKLASSFNFLKKNPTTTESPVKGSMIKDPINEKKDSNPVNIPKISMASFFSSKNTKVHDSEKSIIKENQKDITLSAAKTIESTGPECPAATFNDIGGSTLSECSEEQSPGLNDRLPGNICTSEPSDGGMFLFLSPQKLVRSPEVSDNPKDGMCNGSLHASKSVALRKPETTTTSMALNSCIYKTASAVTIESNNHGRDVPVELKNVGCDEEPGIYDISLGSSTSAADKFRNSMMSMGKMFSKPFSHVQTKTDTEDPMI